MHIHALSQVVAASALRDAASGDRRFARAKRRCAGATGARPRIGAAPGVAGLVAAILPVLPTSRATSADTEPSITSRGQ